MKHDTTSRNLSLLLCAIIWLMLLSPAGARDTKTDFSAADETKETVRAGDVGILQGAPYTYGVYSITEGMRDFPITKKLANTIPLSLDVSVIFVIGWTGDKLFIKVQDELAYSDRIIGIAVAQYGNGIAPFFGSLYSSTTDNSFEMTIPVYAPGITVYLMTGFWGKSLGENPYAYKIILSFPE
jgi:hypothetical protein